LPLLLARAVGNGFTIHRNVMRIPIPADRNLVIEESPSTDNYPLIALIPSCYTFHTGDIPCGVDIPVI
jgi:hypothetical protein